MATYSKDLKTYTYQLLKLQALIDKNDGESDAADEWRDKMDSSWRCMSKDERQRARKISDGIQKMRNKEKD